MKPIKIIACILVATLLYSSLGPVSVAGAGFSFQQKASTTQDPPDLNIAYVRVKPPTPDVNQPIEIYCVIRNLGDAPASDVYVELSYWAHVEKWKGLSVVIPSYGRIAFSFEVNSPTFPDDYEFEVTADPDNEIRESNENNNVWSGHLQVSSNATASYFYNELYSKEAFCPGTHISHNFANELESHAQRRYETSGNILDILTDLTEGRTLLLTDHINELIVAIELSSIELAVDTN